MAIKRNAKSFQTIFPIMLTNNNALNHPSNIQRFLNPAIDVKFQYKIIHEHFVYVLFLNRELMANLLKSRFGHELYKLLNQKKKTDQEKPLLFYK